MQRYFAELDKNKVILSKDDEHHVLHVMRNHVGDCFEVVASNKLYLCLVKGVNPLEIEVIKEIDNQTKSKDINLFFALAKGEKIDFVIQKATELGVKNIVLISLKRCVVKLDNEDFKKKIVRYNKIAKEAAEQCHRLDIPNILGIYSLNNLPKELLEGNKYIAYEKEAGSTANFYEELASIDVEAPISVAIGPEGGFEEVEVNKFNELGFKNISLGNRILRTETAAVYALSVISFMLER